MERFAAIDFETANQNRSSVCSVGIVIVENGEIANQFHSLICPRPNFYTYWTTHVHGMVYEDTADAPDFPTVWKEIAPQIANIPLIAHNSPFDEGCLKAVFNAYGMDYPNYSFYCTCRLSRKLHPYLQNHKLNTVSEHCGFNLKQHHHALADAEACARIALHMMEERMTDSLDELVKSIYC